MAPQPNERFLDRVRQRKLAQWTLAYLAGAWVLLQALDMAASTFNWPASILRATWVLLATGFVAVLIVAWYHGERGQQRVSGIEILMLATLLAIAGAALKLATARSDASADSGGDGAQPPVDVADEASVVVLPFADLSPNRDQEYFADGLTEEILNALVRIPQLRVPARTTSFSFKNKNVPVSDIARQLRVAHVLEGSVRKDDDRLRITTQLVDARVDRHLWSEQYDRSIADVFAVQEEIANAVAVALKVRLSTPAAPAADIMSQALVARESADPAAYELYLRGLHAWNTRTTESLLRAMTWYEQAVRQDANFARAWAGLALTYVLLPEYLDTLSTEWTPRARNAAQRALALDPLLAEAHTALAWANVLDWNHVDGEREFRRALEINPSFPTAHQWYGSMLNSVGRSEEARAHMERARELDPLSFIINANFADQFYYARQYERALSLYDQAIALNSDALGGAYHAQRAISLLFLGRNQEAFAAAESLLARAKEGDIMARTQAAHVVARLKPDAGRMLVQSLEERARRRYVSPTMRAYVYVALGDHDRAFELLQDAVNTRDPSLHYYITNDPVFDPLREDPRFARIVEGFRTASPPGQRR